MSGKDRFNIDIKGSLPYALGVIISFMVAFYLRTIPKAGVFLSNGFVRFGGNDPWYHLRNVESILHNYPNMLWFDAYTQYPLGQNQVFAPLFDMFLSTIIWVLGGGNPDQELIYSVCAYYPVVLGSLVAIPTYFVAKWLFDRRVGVLAAFLVAIAPGQILSRSTIGFNDHHIGETLLSTITAMFLIMAINTAREHNITFEGLKNKQFDGIKPALPYFILTGVSLGAYTLAWKGALFFSLIIGVYIAIQHIVDHLHKRDTDYLAVGGIVIFAIAFIMVLLVPYLGGTKAMHLKGLFAGIIAFPALTAMSKLLNKKDYPGYYYPGLALASFVLVVVLAKVFSPSSYALITSVFGYFMQTGGGLTVAEASPLLSVGGVFSLQPIWYNFGLNGYLSFLALGILIYGARKKSSQEKTFLIIWSLMIIWAMLQQNRFAYYYSVNMSILAAYLGVKIMDLAGLSSLGNRMKGLSVSEIIAKFSFIENVKPLIAVFVILVILVYPAYSLSVQQSQGTGGPNGYWIETTMWLNENTPDTGLDYYENYERPPSGESYQYPESAYGVMSWWDYGHWIEVIGRRIPNANPFQAGIGGRRNSIEEENMPGASTFFTAPTEAAATQVLEAVHPDPDKAGARYIVSDVEMATGKFYAMSAWTLDTADYYVSVMTDQGYQNVPGQRYFNTMEARLHMFDGNGLKQYRMVYESHGTTTAETGYKNVYNVLYGGNIPVVDTGYVKIFEYVEGARITGSAPAGEKVTISNTILSNQMRTFEYKQTTTSDGTFEFIVPYSTTGPIEGQTQFATGPIGPYTVSYQDTSTQVSVTEQDVLNGATVAV